MSDGGLNEAAASALSGLRPGFGAPATTAAMLIDDFDDQLRFAAAEFNVAKDFSGPLKTAKDCSSGSEVFGVSRSTPKQDRIDGESPGWISRMLDCGKYDARERGRSSWQAKVCPAL